MTNQNSHFKELLQSYRKRHNLRQEDVARLFGVSHRLVSFWESGEREPSGTSMWRVATTSQDPEVVGLAMLALRLGAES